MTAQPKLLSDDLLNEVFYRLKNDVGVLADGLKDHIAALTQQRDDAQKDAANWKHSFEAQNSELQRLAHDAEDRDDAIERLTEIGRAIGCDHHGDPDGRSRLVSCVEETIANLEQQLDAARQEAERAKVQLAALSAPGDVEPARFEVDNETEITLRQDNDSRRCVTVWASRHGVSQGIIRITSDGISRISMRSETLAIALEPRSDCVRDIRATLELATLREEIARWKRILENVLRFAACDGDGKVNFDTIEETLISYLRGLEENANHFRQQVAELEGRLRDAESANRSLLTELWDGVREHKLEAPTRGTDSQRLVLAYGCGIVSAKQKATDLEYKISLRDSELAQLRQRLAESDAIRNVQYKGLSGAETFIEAVHTELFMVEMNSDDKARLQDKLKDAAREISGTMGTPTRQILIKQEYQIADLEKKLAAAKEQLAACQEALSIAINSVECASICPRTGEELPWYRAAKKCLTGSPRDNKPEENPCSKIFDHAWLDPVCVESGCQSLLLKKSHEQLAARDAELATAKSRLDALSTDLATAEARCGARERELERYRKACEKYQEALEWCIGNCDETINCAEDAPWVFVESGGDDIRVLGPEEIEGLWPHDAAHPAPATQPDSPPAFRCPRCGGEIDHRRDPNNAWCEVLLCKECNWKGTFAEVAAAKGWEGTAC